MMPEEETHPLAGQQPPPPAHNSGSSSAPAKPLVRRARRRSLSEVIAGTFGRPLASQDVSLGADGEPMPKAKPKVKPPAGGRRQRRTSLSISDARLMSSGSFLSDHVAATLSASFPRVSLAELQDLHSIFSSWIPGEGTRKADGLLSHEQGCATTQTEDVWLLYERHCTALHCTALHCTALHCTALLSE